MLGHINIDIKSILMHLTNTHLISKWLIEGPAAALAGLAATGAGLRTYCVFIYWWNLVL